MRVLLTTDVVGGVWTYALDLARALRAERVEVVLAVTGGELSPERRRTAEAVCTAVHARPYRLIWMPEPWADVAAARRWLAELVETTAPDVVHANDWGLADGAWETPTVVVAHSCVPSWWEAVRGEPAPPEWDRYRAAVRDALARADAVVAPTAAMGAALVRHHGHVGARVIHNGVDPRGFRPLATLPYVITCGRLWDEAKDVATLSRAAREIEWPVLAAGETRHPAGGRREPLGGVLELGRLPRRALAAWLGGAAIYAHPARYEPFGLAPLEAALAGCALVLADVPTMRELWSDAARFFPPGDAAALARALRELAADPEETSRLAAAARVRAARYGLGRAAAAYAALYAELAAGRPRPVVHTTTRAEAGAPARRSAS